MHRIAFALVGVIMIGCNIKTPELISLEYTSNESELFAPDIISTGLYERDIAITNAGDEMIYTLGNHKQNKRVLVGIKHKNDTWSEPYILPFSGEYNDIEPAFSPDNKRLFYASDRPLHNDENSDYNIWYVDYSDSSWGEPVALDTLINTPSDEFYPSLTEQGNLYFTATKDIGIGLEDIYISEYSNGAYQAPTPLDTNVNSRFYEFNAYISPTEDLIIFSSYGRSDDMGGGDLYYSMKGMDGRWLPSKNMGPQVNSEALDYCPFIDQARRIFYFTSDRTSLHNEKPMLVQDIINQAHQPLNGFGNIYRVNTADLFE